MVVSLTESQKELYGIYEQRTRELVRRFAQELGLDWNRVVAFDHLTGSFHLKDPEPSTVRACEGYPSQEEVALAQG